MSTSEFPMPARDEIRLTDILKALSDPGRLQMVQILAGGELHSCSPEVFPIGVQKSTLSHHFKTLREAGLTETHREGRNCSVRLRVEDLDAKYPGLLGLLTSGAAAVEVALAREPARAS